MGPLILRRFNLTVESIEHRGFWMQSLSREGFLPARRHAHLYPEISRPRRLADTLRLFSLCVRMPRAPSLGPFHSVPFRGVDPRGRWISLIVSRRMGRDGSSTRPLYSTAFSLPFLLLPTFALSAFTISLYPTGCSLDHESSADRYRTKVQIFFTFYKHVASCGVIGEE